MKTQPPRTRVLITYAAFYLAFASVAARAIFTLRYDSGFWFMIGMLALYLLPMLVEPWLLPRNPAYLHGINFFQTAITLILLLTIGRFDSFSLLLLPPVAQSVLNFPRKIAFSWVGAICVFNVAALLIHFPFSESVGYIIVYPAAFFLVSGFCYLALQSEKAQARSEMLMADLQKAHEKLQAYADQVRELAAVEERNRLARELHDSVTQIIFGLTLAAQAARILINRDPVRATAELDHIQILAQSALGEMRGLIQQLHPHTNSEKDLASELNRMVTDRQSNDGLTIDLQVKGKRSLPVNIEADLFRVAQEALNNIVKHAKTDRAVINLDLEDENRILLVIEDYGIGFDLAKTRALPGHLGLTSMAERIQKLGGSLIVDSKPGKGTRVQVELTMAQEVEHA